MAWRGVHGTPAGGSGYVDVLLDVVDEHDVRAIAGVDAEEVGCDLEEGRVVFLVADVGSVDDTVDRKRCTDSPG